MIEGDPSPKAGRVASRRRADLQSAWRGGKARCSLSWVALRRLVHLSELDLSAGPPAVRQSPWQIAGGTE